jgi:hypothetical protein
MPHATVNKVVVMILIINDLLLGRSRGLHEDLLNIPFLFLIATSVTVLFTYSIRIFPEGEIPLHQKQKRRH